MTEVKILINPINTSLNARSSSKTDFEGNASITGESKEKNNNIKINDIDDEDNETNENSYFLPTERVSIRTFALNYCICMPVFFDLIFSRHRSRLAAFFIYLQLMLSIILLIYGFLADIEDFPDLLLMSTCASIKRQISFANNILYIPYMIVSLLAVSRFQISFWLLIAAPVSIIFFGVLSAEELPNCIEILQMPIGVIESIPENDDLSLQENDNLILPRVNLTIGSYGIFRWLCTLVVTFEFIRLARLLMYDIIYNNARPKCYLEENQRTTNRTQLEIVEWGTKNKKTKIDNIEEEEEIEEPSLIIKLRELFKSIITEFKELIKSYIIKLKVLLCMLYDLAIRAKEIPLRHAIAISMTCVILFLISTSITGWCETFRLSLNSLPNDEPIDKLGDEPNNEPSDEPGEKHLDENINFFEIANDVVIYLPISSWIITVLFWIINIHSIYVVSEHHRHILLRHKSEKEGIANANMNPLLDAQLAPQINNYVVADASIYIIAHLLCNLIAYGFACCVLLGMILLKVIVIDWDGLFVIGSIFSLPFFIGLLRKCLPYILPRIIELFLSHCINSINFKCKFVCKNINSSFQCCVCERVKHSIQCCFCETLENTIRNCMGVICCISNCFVDGQYVLVPRCFLAMDCIGTLLVAPFTGAAIAFTRCMYGSLWGIVALSQLHTSILPTFLESNDYPYQYYGGMMRASHQELIDEENDSIPSIERKEEWR
jgi:hypothetical protein